MKTASISSFAALVLATSMGCGDGDAGQVSGTLLRPDGTPLVGARVVARSADSGVTVSGSTDASGRFELRNVEGTGIPAGNYDVGVLEDRGDRDSRRPPSISPKYADPGTSGLTVAVGPGETKTLNVTLDPP